METLGNDGDGKKDLDDSGCVQDVGPPPKQLEVENRPAELMDLSDDVLLYILRYCCPRDLKALGFTCPRLGRLIRDRTLWTRVDARSQPTGRARMRWLLAHALSASTTQLLLTGYAREARGCLGHVNRKRKEVEEEKASREKESQERETASTSDNRPGSSSSQESVQIIQVDPLTRLQQLYATGVTRFSGSPSWPEDGAAEVDPEDVVLLDGSCPGPQFTLTQCMLRQLRAHCSLTELALQYCNINCNTTGIAHFPPTLKKLSLRGAKCYNLPLDKSFLFNIQDYLPELEWLELSECEWLEPASLLPLSKVGSLRRLLMRDCYRLSEFVAYASLATRYGFRKLEVLDVRGSPVADSEVSALGWLPALRELYLAPAPRVPPHPRDHSHYRDEPLPPHLELEPWEMEEPDYFKIKPQIVEPMDTRPNMTIDEIEEHIEQLRDYENNICLHGTEYNLCMEGIRRNAPRKRPADAEASTTPAKKEHKISPSPSPSTSTATSKQNGAKNETENATPDSTTSDVTGDKIGVTGYKTEVTAGKSDVTAGKSDATAGKSEVTTGVSDVTAGKSDVTAGKSSENTGGKLADSTGDYVFISRNRATSSSGPSKREEPSTSTLKRKHSDLKDEPSCSKDNKTSKSKVKKSKSDDSDSSDDDNVPLKLLCQNGVNEGASTSKSPPKEPSKEDEPKCKNPGTHAKECACNERKVYEFVRFRQNMDPVIVRRDQNEVEREHREREQREREMEENQNREVRPRAHVLYVNVGQQLHTVYRLSIHNEPPIFYSFAGNSHLRFRPNVGNIFYTPPTPHLDATSLVSDSAVRRFGRADVDDVNYIHIGPRQGPGEPGARPNRSSLRVLSITGFRNITDRSLVHLATAAPDLRLIDFSETRVTAQGVENFKSLRPDCEVKFSEYVDKDD